MTVAVPVPLLHALATAATVDASTGLLNRTAWHGRAREQLNAPTGPTALLLVDVDRFATINAAEGHLAADAALATIAHTLRVTVGSGGIVGRYGGDEFVVLLPGHSVTRARRLAEEARGAVAGLAVAVDAPAGPRRLNGLTVSVGGAVHHGPQPDLTALLWSADAALYAAKHVGGDTVRIESARRSGLG